MAVDIATLGIRIDSDGVTTGADRLRKLATDGTAAEASTTKLSSSFDSLSGYVKTAAAALGLYKLAEMAKDAALLSARYEAMGAAMQVVGNNAGYTGTQMNAFQAALQKQGIGMVEARQVLIQMSSAQMDLSKSSGLAVIAQNAARVAQINSSEAYERMISGIQRGETEIMKTLGLNVDFAKAQDRLAISLGKSTNDLTAAEKVQANMNATILKGKDIAGVYNATMEQASGQIQSLKRYMDNLKVVTGSVFNDVLVVGVKAFTGALVAANDEAGQLKLKGQFDNWGRDMVMGAAAIADGLYIAYASLNTFVVTGVAGFTQLYYGAKSLGQALLMDFSGAKESFDNLLNAGAAWMDMVGKQWDGATKYQDAAKQMYAQRDNDIAKIAAAEKSAALEKDRMSAGTANKESAIAAQQADTIKKNQTAWGAIVVAQLESVGQYEKATGLAVELNKQTDAYKTLLNASTYSKEAQAALDAQSIVDANKLLEAKRKGQEKIASLLQDQFSIMQKQIDITSASGLTEEAFEQQRVLDVMKVKFEYGQKMIDYQKQLVTATAEEGVQIKANMALYSQMAEMSMNEINNRKMAVTAAATTAATATAASGSTGYGSTWGHDANGNLLNATTTAGAAGTGGGLSVNADAFTGVSNGNYYVQGINSSSFGNSATAMTTASSKASGAGLAMAFSAMAKNEEAAKTLAAAEKAAADAAAAQAAAIALAQAALNKELDVRELILAGNTDEAAVRKLMIAQTAEQTAALAAGLDISRLVTVQQAELNKLMRDQALAKATKQAATFFATIKTALTDMASAGNSLVSSLRTAATALRQTSGDLSTGTATTLSPEALYNQTRLNLSNTVQQALASGDAALYSKIPAMVTAYLEQSKSYNASSSQYGADFAWAQNLLNTSATAADDAADHAAAVITAAEKQQATLDAIQAALTTDNTAALPKLFAELSSNTGTLNSAVAATNSALGTSGTLASRLTGVSTSVTAGADSTAAWLTTVNDTTSTVNTGITGVKTAVAPLSAIQTNTAPTGSVSSNTGTTATKVSQHQTRATMTYTYSTQNATLGQLTGSVTDYTYAAFAKGGKYPGGSALMGENGPELVDSSPGYVYRADETKALFEMAKRGVGSADNYGVIAELREMRAEIIQLRKESVAKLKDIESPLRRAVAR